jgi:hypothetical protein
MALNLGDSQGINNYGVRLEKGYLGTIDHAYSMKYYK